MNDDRVLSLVELTQPLVTAWPSVLTDLPPCAAPPCPDDQELADCVAGGLGFDQALLVAEHLAACGRCRQEVRDLRLLRDAGRADGSLSLPAVRDLLGRRPDLGVRALVRLSRRLVSLLLAEPPDADLPQTRKCPLLDGDGEPLGEWITLRVESVPYVDSGHRLCLDVAPVPAAWSGCLARVLVRTGQGRLDLGAALLANGQTALAVDLSDLAIPVGRYLPPDCLEVVVETGPQTQSAGLASLVQTGPQRVPTSVAAAVRAASTSMAGIPVRSEESSA